MKPEEKTKIMKLLKELTNSIDRTRQDIKTSLSVNGTKTKAEVLFLIHAYIIYVYRIRKVYCIFVIYLLSKESFFDNKLSIKILNYNLFYVRKKF